MILIFFINTQTYLRYEENKVAKSFGLFDNIKSFLGKASPLAIRYS